MVDRQQQAEMLQGTLDMLVLQSLVLGPAHGYTIARLIQQRSDHLLQVGQGSLYPALHRLETRAWIAGFWGTSENNRKARYYSLTSAGRTELKSEAASIRSSVAALRALLDAR